MIRVVPGQKLRHSVLTHQRVLNLERQETITWVTHWTDRHQISTGQFQDWTRLILAQTTTAFYE